MKYRYKKQGGFGVVAMILTIVGIIAVLSFFILRGTDTSTVLNNAAITNSVVAQASVIRSRILACAVEYPTGNNTTGYHVVYPGATSATAVSSLTCPGAGNANLWTLLDGVNAPLALNGFNNWQYINDASSVRISITATTTEKSMLLSTLTTVLGPQASNSSNTLTWIITN